ncbi:hypothetical protein COOONC_25752 [Cooperia oncophora]
MTENRLQEVYLGNMEASVVDALVKFCYSGEINISNANVLNILSTARLFQLDQVEELCREFLKRKLEPSSSLVVRPVTDSISCPEADENVLHNFENAVNTEKAHEILVNQLVELILNEELSVRLMAQVYGPVLYDIVILLMQCFGGSGPTCQLENNFYQRVPTHYNYLHPNDSASSY